VGTQEGTEHPTKFVVFCFTPVSMHPYILESSKYHKSEKISTGWAKKNIRGPQNTQKTLKIGE
jgi:hypothetical protein